MTQTPRCVPQRGWEQHGKKLRGNNVWKVCSNIRNQCRSNILINLRLVTPATVALVTVTQAAVDKLKIVYVYP